MESKKLDGISRFATLLQDGGLSRFRFLPVSEVSQRRNKPLGGVVMSEKRSERIEIAQASTQGDLFSQGVGARQGEAPPPTPGGEYLNNCDLPNFSKPAPAPDAEKKRRDPRFEELEKIGLPAVWLRIAERVGFDTWLDLWRTLSEDESVRHDGGARLPKIRCFSAYSRYQRNRYIKALAAQGMPPKEIQTSLRKNLGEHLDLSNIIRMTRRPHKQIA